MSWSAAAEFAAPIVGGLFGKSDAKKANKAAAEMAEKQMAFQREMATNAHQYQVADLRAAGLNPRLSASLGGASTPSGAMAPVIDEGKSTREGVSSAMSALMARAQIKNIHEQNNNLQASSAASIADAKLKTAQTQGAHLTNVITGVDADLATDLYGLGRPGASAAAKFFGNVARGASMTFKAGKNAFKKFPFKK